MRILQLVTKPQRRGAEIFACQLNKWLQSQGHDVLTLYLYHHFANNSLQPSTPNTNALAEQRSPLEKLPGVNPWLAAYLRKTLNHFGPNVVQANGGRALKYGLLAKRLSHPPTALVYRCIGSPRFWSKGPVGRFLTKAAVRNADGVVAVSDATLSEFGKPAPHQLQRRIHRGADLKALRESRPVSRANLQTPAEAKVLLYVGSLSQEKCPLRAIEVLKILADKGHDIYLWMLGDGPLESTCRDLANDLGVGERLRLVGTVDNVGSYMASAELQLLTSDTEGLPGCLVEAAALGLPCVAADVGGVREIALHGETGFVVQANEISEYVKHSEILLTDLELHRRFSVRASEWADSFSMDTIGPQYLELYQELLQRKRP